MKLNWSLFVLTILFCRIGSAQDTKVVQKLEGLDCNKPVQARVAQILSDCEALGKLSVTETKLVNNGGDLLGYQYAYSCKARELNYDVEVVTCTQEKHSSQDERIKKQKEKFKSQVGSASGTGGVGTGVGASGSGKIVVGKSVNVDGKVGKYVAVRKEVYKNGKGGKAKADGTYYLTIGGNVYGIGGDHPCYASNQCKPGKEDRKKCQKCLSGYDYVFQEDVAVSSDASADAGTGSGRHDGTGTGTGSGRHSSNSSSRHGSGDAYDPDGIYFIRNGRKYYCTVAEYQRNPRNCFSEDMYNDTNRRYLDSRMHAGSVCDGNCAQAKGAQIINSIANLGLGFGGMVGQIVSSNNARRAAGYQWDAFTANSNNMLASYQYGVDAQLAGYQYGLDRCIGHRENYWGQLVAQEYGLPNWTEPDCNGYMMDQFSGYNGMTQNPFGGVGNAFLGAGYSQGFLGGMIGPYGAGGINPFLNSNPSCMCISAPCPCANIGGGVGAGINPFFNGGLNLNWNAGIGATMPWGGGSWGGGLNGGVGGFPGGFNPYAQQKDYYNSMQDLMIQQQMGMYGGGFNQFGGAPFTPWNMGSTINYGGAFFGP